MPGDAAKSKRPTDSKFKQQKLAAWKPILTPRTVLPIFLVVGVAFIAVGIALLFASDSVKEQSWDYTNCKQIDSPNAGESCAALLSNASLGYTNNSDVTAPRCRCTLNVTLDDYSDESVYLYYTLENYYQNHRRYVKSRWDPQLRATTADGSAECDPLNNDEEGRTYAPCGLVANSLFNDTIKLSRCDDASCTTTTPVKLSGEGIAWKSDRDTKFRNPPVPAGKTLCDAVYFNNTAKPPAWPVHACKLGTNDTSGLYSAHTPEFGSSGVGYENEDLIVWMRSAALPNFRKLYRRVEEDLNNGSYVLQVDYNYPVESFDGHKGIVLSTTSWAGGRNSFLGVAYLVVGVLCVVAAVVFVGLQRCRGRELGADKYLTWDR